MPSRLDCRSSIPALVCGRGIVADHATGAGGVAAYAAPACGENGERRDGDERVPSCGSMAAHGETAPQVS